jgi:hypothetical protein
MLSLNGTFTFVVNGAPGVMPYIPTNYVPHETPTGAMDGVNRDYTTAHNFLAFVVFLNGLRQSSGVDYAVTGLNAFRMTIPPGAADTLECEYWHL